MSVLFKAAVTALLLLSAASITWSLLIKQQVGYSTGVPARTSSAPASAITDAPDAQPSNGMIRDIELLRSSLTDLSR